MNPTVALARRIQAAADAGADWVQIREKDLCGRELLDLASGAVALPSLRVIVNDRADVALAARAAGVHLGGDSAPLQEIVRWLRAGAAAADFVIGVSCHSVGELRNAEAGGASYAFFGPIFDTPSKRTFGEPQGLASLKAVCRAVRMPVIAIGGINEANAADCVCAGAAGVAAIRMFQDSSDRESLKAAIARIREAMQ